MGFVKVLNINDLKHGECKVVEVDGNEVALFNVKGEFFAIRNTCPHRGGSLGEGMLEGNIVTCPLHGWQFDVKNGQNARMPGPNVACYKVKVEDDDIFVSIE
ncbi:MAG TPA: non-heme iron oxygenase ferredoxin subunit [Candidatus Nanoarchaeia archaeon]|nr:non-heme iron oxygenase ferredoxin subunit [Candidatus Nanoarchaeia archaeon]